MGAGAAGTRLAEVREYRLSGGPKRVIMSLREKLNKIAEKDSSNWLEETGKELVEQGAHKKARQLALLVLQLLHRQGMTQTQLAERMGVSRQQVTKIVKGRENFTFETIDKLEKALGVTLMTIG
jgi:ribosome-binding protein aMBF1 (putative translation factor)